MLRVEFRIESTFYNTGFSSDVKLSNENCPVPGLHSSL